MQQRKNIWPAPLTGSGHLSGLFIYKQRSDQLIELIKSIQSVIEFVSFECASKAEERKSGYYNLVSRKTKNMSIRCTFWKEDYICGARDNKLSEPAVSLPLATLDRDVTHLLVKVGAGGNKLSASHRVENFPEWKLILNQAGLSGITKDKLKKIVICPRHRRKFTRLRDQGGPCQHPLHQGEKTKLRKPKKVTADVSDGIFQEFGIVIPIASRKYSRLE